MKDNKCFLCGGQLINGKCIECGLDNNKNDKKYQLNTHNNSGAHFHDGGCDDNLNQKKIPVRKRKQQAQKEETFDYGKMLEAEKKKEHSASASSRKKQNQNAGTAKKRKPILFWVVILYVILMAGGTLMGSVAEIFPELRHWLYRQDWYYILLEIFG